ncbi:hypothetical protein [Oceaniglobus indicus]|uniref:hypothetical protein n=1 Tax=Oceaniglobus indicus TaxID=2047749 RepID=UPI000C1A1044|nr:hypothetical protein [Oceaniglobus indicus]
MSELDPIRPPKNRRFLVSLVVGVCILIGMIVSMSWWNGAEVWKMMVAAIVSTLIGLAIARRIPKPRK